MPGDREDLLRAVLAHPEVRVAKGPDRRGWYTAWCLFHPDGRGKPPHNPNLRISERGYCCHACRASGSLFDLARKLGLSVSGWGERVPDAVYDYRDDSGALLFQVVRFPGKQIRCRRPEGDGWAWGLGDTQRVLYNLPAVLEHADDPVYVCEGEKDVDRLLSLGLLATCNPHGAGKWRDTYAESLRGRHVVVLPDNDESGLSHAQDVAASVRSVAASVRIVRLPDLEPKGDVSDWLSLGHTVEELAGLVEKTPEVGTPPTTKSRSPEAQVREAIIDRLLPQLAHLSGEENRLYIDNASGWVRLKHRALLRYVVDLMFSLSGNYPDHRKASEVVKLLTNLVQARVEYADRPAIAFTNCTLVLDPASGELEEAAPSGVFTHLPYRLVGGAQPSAWSSFLSRIMPDEPLRAILQEFLGLALFVNYNPQKALVLVGPGANGKTTLLKVLSRVFDRHTAAVNINALEDARLLDALDGALLNVSEETLTDRIIASAAFKAVTGDSLLLANPKYQMPYQICPTAQWIIATNHIPTFDETTLALARRLLFIPMEVTLPASERRPLAEIVAAVEPERESILAWMLAGARRFFAQRSFSYSAKSEEVFQQWKRENSPILYWLHTEQVPSGSARIASLYDRYKGWARDKGFRVLSIRSFTRQIRVLGMAVSHRNDGNWVELDVGQAPSFEDWLED